VILDCGVLAGQTPLIYGSEGWGFESLRARPGQRPVPILGPAFRMPRIAAKYSNADRNGGS
jgi:hypothetical protein